MKGKGKYLIIIACVIMATICGPVLTDNIFNGDKLVSSKVVLVLESKNRKPCKHSPNTILLTNMVRT